METPFLDIYLDDVNSDYLNKLSFLVLYKSRKLGFSCAADMFCEAYRVYDDKISDITLKTLETRYTCAAIVKRCDIEYKEDLVYIIRHPELIRLKKDPFQKPVRKKVLQFQDLGTSGNEYKKEAFDYLDSLRPIKRAPAIDKIIYQYMVRTGNGYFFEQAAARLLEDLPSILQFDDDDNLTGASKDVIDTIWRIGVRRK